MTLTPIKTPMLVKRMFPNYIWDIPTTSKTIYLTFDDGPTPEITSWTLNILKQYNAKATFFCIGSNIEKHPSIFQDVINNNHAIGNHTYNHIKGWQTKTKDYLKNIDLCESVFKSQTSKQTKIANPKTSIKKYQSKSVNLFRPPYGQIKPKQGRKLIGLGYKIVMWDVLSFDWDATVSPETCLNRVITKATSGSIIVFHDSIKASKNMQYALPKVLEHFSKKGYTFKSLEV